MIVRMLYLENYRNGLHIYIKLLWLDVSSQVTLDVKCKMLEFEMACPKCGLILHDNPPMVKEATWLTCSHCGYNLIKFFDNPNHQLDYKYGEEKPWQITLMVKR